LLKKTITYEDFEGQTHTEDFYFHLSKADLIEMEMQFGGGYGQFLQKIGDEANAGQIIEQLQKLIIRSYGVRSEDGKSFRKSPQLSEEFRGHPAFSELLLEVCTNADLAAAFATGIMPASADQIAEQLDELKKRNQEPAISEPADNTGATAATGRTFEQNTQEVTILTRAEARQMSSNELEQKLASGKFRIEDDLPS
jgi:hypothetical protein